MGEFNEFIGLPYKHFGRNFDGVDCYGLVYLIFKEKLGVELPDFSHISFGQDWYKTGQDHILNRVGTIDGTYWDIVQKPYKKYDGLIFYLASKEIANHTAVYIGGNKIIHIYENQTSHISVLDNYWESKQYATFRFKG